MYEEACDLYNVAISLNSFEEHKESSRASYRPPLNLRNHETVVTHCPQKRLHFTIDTVATGVVKGYEE